MSDPLSACRTETLFERLPTELMPIISKYLSNLPLHLPAIIDVPISDDEVEGVLRKHQRATVMHHTSTKAFIKHVYCNEPIVGGYVVRTTTASPAGEVSSVGGAVVKTEKIRMHPTAQPNVWLIDIRSLALIFEERLKDRGLADVQALSVVIKNVKVLEQCQVAIKMYLIACLESLPNIKIPLRDDEYFPALKRAFLRRG